MLNNLYMLYQLTDCFAFIAGTMYNHYNTNELFGGGFVFVFYFVQVTSMSFPLTSILLLRFENIFIHVQVL